MATGRTDIYGKKQEDKAKTEKNFTKVRIITSFC